MRKHWPFLGAGLVALVFALAWSMSQRSPTEDSAAAGQSPKIEAQLSTMSSSDAMEPGRPTRSSVQGELEGAAPTSVEAYFEAIEVLAKQGDEKGVSQLGALIALCSQLSNSDSSRFQSSAWRYWTEACRSQDQSSWVALLRSKPALPSPDNQTLASLPPDDASAEQLDRRDRTIEALLASTPDAEIGAAAAYVYLDRERQLAWAQGEVPNALQLPAGSESLRLDASIEFACRIGRDCSPYSPYVLAECAHTAGCLPGVSMRQILQMRRSPQELQLIDTMLGRLLELRRGGG